MHQRKSALGVGPQRQSKKVGRNVPREILTGPYGCTAVVVKLTTAVKLPGSKTRTQYEPGSTGSDICGDPEGAVIIEVLT
jgi:hypothetical protein